MNLNREAANNLNEDNANLQPNAEAPQENQRVQQQNIADADDTRNTTSDDDLKKQDPFLYWSNDERRMAYILGTEEDDNDGNNGNDNGDRIDNDNDDDRQDEEVPLPHQPQQNQTVRRSRITFEVHPCLLLDDLFLGMD